MSKEYAKAEKKVSKNDAFVPEGLGSADKVSLDGKSEIEGYITEDGAIGKVNQGEQTTGLSTRGAPWDADESFKAKCAEAGVDFDSFIERLKNNKPDKEIAKELGLTKKAVSNLRYHFESFGIHSMMGQD